MKVFWCNFVSYMIELREEGIMEILFIPYIINPFLLQKMVFTNMILSNAPSFPILC